MEHQKLWIRLRRISRRAAARAAPLAEVVVEVIHGDALTGGEGSWVQVGLKPKIPIWVPAASPSPSCSMVQSALMKDHPCSIFFFLDDGLLPVGFRGRSNRVPAGGMGATSSV
jgi:hypothetical protein